MIPKNIYKIIVWIAIIAAISIVVHDVLHPHDLSEESHCLLCNFEFIGITFYSVLFLLKRQFSKLFLPVSVDIPNSSEQTKVYTPRSPPLNI